MQLFKRNRDGAKETGAAVAEQASTAAQQAERFLDQGIKNASAAVSTARERGEQAAERSGEVLEEYRSAIESSVRSQPMTSLFLAALAGIAFGALWRSARR